MISPLLVDVSVYQDRTIRFEDWQRLVDAGPPWSGAILKATEGTGGAAAWQRKSAAWFDLHWPVVGALPLWRGAYHFLLVDGAAAGAEQADFYIDTIERAGGHGDRDLWPMVDVEEGSGNAARAQRHGRAIVEETCAAFVARVHQRIARPVVLYAGWWLASLGIRSRMGCSALWYAAYVAKLEPAVYQRIGWDEASLWAWQYAGGFKDGKPTARRPGYPVESPVGQTDISAVMRPGGLERMRWAERPLPSVCATGPDR